MTDMYFIECSKCGYQVPVVLDEKPNKDVKVICDFCKEKEEDDDFLNW